MQPGSAKRPFLWLAIFLGLPSMVGRDVRAGALEVLPAAAFDGDSGLRVTVGTTCPVAHIDVPAGVVSTDLLACNTISAGNVEVVSPGVTFVAGEQIALEDGFSVASGASFTADVDPFVNGPYAFVAEDSPAAETIYKARFYVRLDDLALAETDEMGLFIGYGADGAPEFRLVLRRRLSQNRLALFAWDEGAGGLVEHGVDFLVTGGFRSVEVHWKAGFGDGELMVAIDGGALDGLSGLDNGDSTIEFVKWGAVDGALSGSSGSMDLDAFESWRAP